MSTVVGEKKITVTLVRLIAIVLVAGSSFSLYISLGNVFATRVDSSRIFSAIVPIVVIFLAAGLWRMRRWAVVLLTLLCFIQFFTWYISGTYVGTDMDSAKVAYASIFPLAVLLSVALNWRTFH